VAVEARLRRSRRRRRNAWTAAEAAATASSGIDRPRRRRSYTVLYTYTYSVLPARRRRLAPTCARRRFSISRVYIFTFSLYIPTVHVYNIYAQQHNFTLRVH